MKTVSAFKTMVRKKDISTGVEGCARDSNLHVCLN